MSDILIRTFEPGDEQGIADVILPIQRKEFGIAITAADQPDLTDIPGFYQTGKGQFWVAVKDGAVCRFTCGAIAAVLLALKLDIIASDDVLFSKPALVKLLNTALPAEIRIKAETQPEGLAVKAFQEVLDSGCLRVNAMLPHELTRALMNLYMQIDHLINQGAKDETTWQCMSYGAQIAANKLRLVARNSTSLCRALSVAAPVCSILRRR